MPWLARVGPHPSDAAALRVEISSGGTAADGWVTPLELERTLPDSEPIDVPVINRRTGLPVELEPGTDLVLEEEVVMADSIGCAWAGCTASFVVRAGVGGRRPIYCEAHRNSKHGPPKVFKVPNVATTPAPERVKAPQWTPEQQSELQERTPAPITRIVAPRNTPYDAVIADLLVKRDQLDRAIDALREIAGAA